MKNTELDDEQGLNGFLKDFALKIINVRKSGSCKFW